MSNNSIPPHSLREYVLGRWIIFVLYHPDWYFYVGFVLVAVGLLTWAVL